MCCCGCWEVDGAAVAVGMSSGCGVCCGCCCGTESGMRGAVGACVVVVAGYPLEDAGCCSHTNLRATRVRGCLCVCVCVCVQAGGEFGNRK